jgi:Bacterial PH domain
MGKLFDIVFNNAYQVDASAAEGNVRRDYPKLLHETERIELAFQDRGGAGRDGQYFTSHRIIIKDGKGVGNKRKSYLTIPYDSILAFGVQTSAAAIDDDVELSLWTTAHTKIKLDMAKGKVDLFQLYQYLNSKIKWSVDRGTSDVIDATPPNMDKKQTKLGNVVDWLGDNAKQIVAADVEKMFKTDYPILLGDEKVELAFKSGRDTTCFTSRRMLIVDVKGMFGKKIEFVTVPVQFHPRVWRPDGRIVFRPGCGIENIHQHGRGRPVRDQSRLSSGQSESIRDPKNPRESHFGRR